MTLPGWELSLEEVGGATKTRTFLWGSSTAPTQPVAHRFPGSPQPRPAAAGCAAPQAPGRVLPGRRDVLIGWAEAAEEAAEAAAAASARGDPEHSPAGSAEAAGARRKQSRGARLGRARGSRGRAAAASVAMCAQVWLLTDRLIREDYPQVQILRALRQRCSEQDVGFRAVFLDQIAVTVVGGHLGELSRGREGGAPGSREPAALLLEPGSEVAPLQQPEAKSREDA